MVAGSVVGLLVVVVVVVVGAVGGGVVVVVVDGVVVVVVSKSVNCWQFWSQYPHSLEPPTCLPRLSTLDEHQNFPSRSKIVVLTLIFHRSKTFRLEVKL